MSPTLTAESALISIGILKERLTHAINFLIKSEQVNGTLPPGIQFGIRILQSRQRMLDRLWFKHFGSAEEQEKAKIELNLARQDMGELIRLGERNHGIGRLDCRACEYIYSSSGRVESLAKLCAKCHKGIAHLFQRRTDEIVVKEPSFRISQFGEEYELSRESSETLISQGIYRLFWQCDNCKAEGMVKEAIRDGQ